jgi:hypothetical protein
MLDAAWDCAWLAGRLGRAGLCPIQLRFPRLSLLCVAWLRRCVLNGVERVPERVIAGQLVSVPVLMNFSSCCSLPFSLRCTLTAGPVSLSIIMFPFVSHTSETNLAMITGLRQLIFQGAHGWIMEIRGNEAFSWWLQRPSPCFGYNGRRCPFQDPGLGVRRGLSW